MYHDHFIGAYNGFSQYIQPLPRIALSAVIRLGCTRPSRINPYFLSVFLFLFFLLLVFPSSFSLPLFSQSFISCVPSIPFEELFMKWKRRRSAISLFFQSWNVGGPHWYFEAPTFYSPFFLISIANKEQARDDLSFPTSILI